MAGHTSQTRGRLRLDCTVNPIANVTNLVLKKGFWTKKKVKKVILAIFAPKKVFHKNCENKGFFGGKKGLKG